MNLLFLQSSDIRNALNAFNNITDSVIDQALSLNFTKSDIKVLNYFFNRARSSHSFEVSAITIAQQHKISPATVDRTIKKIENCGIIIKITPKFNPILKKEGKLPSCTYVINPRLLKNFSSKFKHKFTSFFKYLSIAALSLWYVNVEQPLKGYYNNPGISISISERVAPVFNTRGLKNQKREEMDSVMVESTPKISPTLREVTDKLRLTKLGQLKLLVFEDSILSEAWNDFKKLSKINSPFDYLILNCVKKSERRNIPVYWDLFYTSCQRYGLTDNKKYVLPYQVANSVGVSKSNPIRPYRHITAVDKSNPFFKELQMALQNMENSSIEAN